ncbi:MAG TPA: hypothetical protein VNR38_14620, partial [Ureibacillus sp.]|nr:hypothetical protein [Ureibacillus sp.]
MSIIVEMIVEKEKVSEAKKVRSLKSCHFFSQKEQYCFNIVIFGGVNLKLGLKKDEVRLENYTSEWTEE